MDPVTSTITVGELFGKQTVANITIEDAKFWGRPNFAGELNQFKETKRQFTVLIPTEHAETLRLLGWNVKTKILTDEEIASGMGPISSMNVKVDVNLDRDGGERGSDVYVIMGDQREKLTGATMGIIDRARIHNVDMELRAWMYNQDDVDKGLEEPKYSARLVTCVAVIQRSILGDKYGALL